MFIKCKNCNKMQENARKCKKTQENAIKRIKNLKP